VVRVWESPFAPAIADVPPGERLWHAGVDAFADLRKLTVLLRSSTTDELMHVARNGFEEFGVAFADPEKVEHCNARNDCTLVWYVIKNILTGKSA